jgi:hypothetical protein
MNYSKEFMQIYGASNSRHIHLEDINKKVKNGGKVNILLAITGILCFNH